MLTSLSTQGSINQRGRHGHLAARAELAAYRDIVDGGVVGRALLISLRHHDRRHAVLDGRHDPRRLRHVAGGSFGHRTILWIMMITMFFNGGIIPLFLVVSALGGYDQYWALIAPSAVSVFNVIVMRSFFASTAQDLIDSAKIDGAGDWRILWQIVLPTSRAVTAVIALFYAVGYWNSWFNIMLFMPSDSSKWPLQMVLYDYLTQNSQMARAPPPASRAPFPPWRCRWPWSRSRSSPSCIVYPFVQKHFTKGVLLGAIKG